MKQYYKWLLTVIAVCIVTISASFIISYLSIPTEIRERATNNQLQISDIAYDVTKRFGYTVYIEESNIFGTVIDVPYLVLTNNYDGHTLLLRKEPLNEERIISPSAGEYERTPLDKYLSEDFFMMYPDNLRQIIKEVDIDVSNFEYDPGTLFQDREKVKQLQRKVFILSHIELGYKKTRLTDDLGEPLAYFSTRRKRKLKKNGEYVMYYTRSQYHSSSTWAYFKTVWPNGKSHEGGGANFYAYVRPAFCLPNDTSITKTDTDKHYRIDLYSDSYAK